MEGGDKFTNGLRSTHKSCFTFCAEHVSYRTSMSRETNAGRGPEDFKFSRGANRVVAEMKLARSKQLKDGLRKQLPQYMASERARHGFYVVIAFTREEVEAAIKLEELRIQVAHEHAVTIELVVIDASSDKPSASTL